MRPGRRGSILLLGLALVAGTVAYLRSNASEPTSVEPNAVGDASSGEPDLAAPRPTTLAARPAEPRVPAPSQAPGAKADGTGVRWLDWSGRVLDADGKPVEGACVRPVAWTAQGAGAFTDADGKFTLRVAESESARFVVSREGSADTFVTRADLEAGTPIAIAKGERIAGRVRDRSTGEAIVGIWVYARPQASPTSAHPFVATWSTEGVFTVEVPEPGEYVIEAGSRYVGGAPSAFDAWIPSRVEHVATGAQDVVVALDRGLSIEGEIVDENGARAARPMSVDAIARTQSGDLDYTSRRVVRTADGVLRVPGLVRGRYDLWISPDGAAGDAAGAAVSATIVRDIAAGTQGLVVRLTRGYMLTGRLEDGAGGLVLGAGRVYAYREGEDGRNHAVFGEVAGDGTFRVGPLDDGLRYEVLATNFPGRREARVTGVAPRDRGGVVIVLPAGGTIRGRVETTEGKPVPAGVPVGVVGEGADPRAPGARTFAYTAADGTFVADGLADGAFSLEAGGGASGYLGALVRGVKSGGSELVLRVTAGVELSGTLVDERGDPVATTSLQADDGVRMAAMRPFAQVGGDGRFVLRGLRAGRVRLSARSGTSYVELGEVSAPGADVKVVLRLK